MSAKRNVTTPRSKRHCFLLDENLSSPLILDPLNRLTGWTIHPHGAYLEKGATDEQVAAFCGSRGWGLITFDDMRYSPQTMLTLCAFGVRVFKVVRHKDTTFTELQAALVVGRPRILDVMQDKTPAIAHVQLKGHVTVMDRFQRFKDVPDSQLRTIRKFYQSEPFDARVLAKTAT